VLGDLALVAIESAVRDLEATFGRCDPILDSASLALEQPEPAGAREMTGERPA
jgi:hypothetical protein